MLIIHMIKTELHALIPFILLIIPVITGNNNLWKAQTEQGVYIGRQTIINDTKVNYWYGIPYAQQPLGNLRWMPPEPLPASNDTNVAYIPNACPQSWNFGVLLTEACLTLNVYAPENAMNLPVYIWIHGGAFVQGAGILYNATQFVSTSIINSIPVVVVTINYRLGLLGFMADKALYDERSGINNRRTTGNYGILDQIMALNWIKKNINGFGGNPEQITIGGESAGGVSVAILLTSPLIINDTFQRSIIESGGIWPSVTTDLENAIETTGNVLRNLTNCSTVQCLRNLTMSQILVTQNVMPSKGIPVIDGYVLNDIMENNYARGSFLKIPILIGTTTNETSLITCALFNGSATVSQVQAFLTTIYNTTIISKLPSIYSSISTYDKPLTYLNIVYSDSFVHCGSRRIASQFSSYGLPTYIYTYNHLISVAPSCHGVPHTAELPMFFPSILQYLYPNYKFNALEQQLSTNMILYWASFIHTSNPNYKGSPTNWDSYFAASDNDLVLDINSRMRNHYYNTTCSGFWDLYAVTNSTSISSAGIHHYHF